MAISYIIINGHLFKIMLIHFGFILSQFNLKEKECECNHGMSQSNTADQPMVP